MSAKSNFLSLTAIIVIVLTICSTGCSKTADIPTTPRKDTIPVKPKSWNVSTVAGSGATGYLDGADSVAQFHYPSYLTLDSSGTIYVSDLMNFEIRKIAGHQVTTFTGRGISSPNPDFGNLYGLAVDKQNNLFDIEYSLVRKSAAPTSNMIFAGSMQISYKDGQDTAARFNVINRIAIDGQGNLYVPDYDRKANFVMRKITPQGLVSTVPLNDNTGIFSGSDSMHYYLSPVAVDLAGNIYFTANGNSLIKKADPQGNVSILAGAGNLGFTDGKGANAQFNMIIALTTDAAGNLYVVDGGNNAIRKVTSDGTVSTIAGRAGKGFMDGDASVAMFSNPSDIAVDKTGTLFVADAGNNRVRKLQYQ